MLLPLWWWIVIYYMLCLPLSAPVDCVYWFASADGCRGHFDQHSATHGTHNRLTFHYLRQKGLKTKNMLRNATLQCNNMTIINRELVEMGRYCSHSGAIVHKRRARCLCDITCSTFCLSPRPCCIIWAPLNQIWSHEWLLNHLTPPKRDDDWTTEIHPVESIKIMKHWRC